MKNSESNCGISAIDINHDDETFVKNNIIHDFDQKSDSDSELMILKRNGMFVPFCKNRLIKALEAAFRETRKIPVEECLSDDFRVKILGVTEKVINIVESRHIAQSLVSVEHIQDIVESTLADMGLSDIAKDYMIFRAQESNSSKIKAVKLKRRDGSIVRFNPIKISKAIEKAFRASNNYTGIEIVELVNELTSCVICAVKDLISSKLEVDLEEVQDLVELNLMKSNHFDVAKRYILYRAGQAQKRAISNFSDNSRELEDGCLVVREDGSYYKLYIEDLKEKFALIAKDFPDTVDYNGLAEMAFANFYPGIKCKEVEQACIMAARAKIEFEPDHTYVAAALLLDITYQEALGCGIDQKNLDLVTKEAFIKYIDFGIEIGRLSPRLKEFDLEKLASVLDIEQDRAFTYLGIQTLYDRYFIHHNFRRIETPQIFWMRVAMGLALNENDKDSKAIEFYELLSSFKYVSSTPTLFNSGTMHSQLSSCYLSTVSDDLKHIFKVVSDNAILSKWAGGLGNDWTNVRACGALIKGTNGHGQGVIPFIKVVNNTALAVNQGGKRKGAVCAYLELWHLDIEDFLELRKNTGDDRRRTHDINTASWIPDLFFKRVIRNEKWTLFSPDDVLDLHSSYGKKFEALYEEYERKAESGEIKLYKVIESQALWRKMLGMLYETGHPWMTFKDPCNIRSPQDHVGVVNCSNLCTEIVLNTSEAETAVCNLGSVNLSAHIINGCIDEKMLSQTIKTAVRILDNVIDINFYPIPEAYNANCAHRAIGLGLMGFQDALYKIGVSYASNEAVEFADKSMEMISYYAILSSSELAAERGKYPSYDGSKWSRNLLPLDTLSLVKEERGEEFTEFDLSSRMNWDVVRESIKKHGLRNSNIMAIAPTATISNIVGVTQSIEPMYKHLFVKSNLSGEFTIVNTFLIHELKKLGLWDADMLDDLKYFDGSLLEINRIPERVKKLFLTAFEIDPEWMIDCAARRQKWIDMAQSLNLYLAEPNGRKMANMYMHAWKKGLKTTYYLRALGATSVEKSSTDINKRGIQPRWMKNKSASSNIAVIREPSVCNLEEGCESCQ